MFFACFWLEGFRTSIDHRVDTMFLKKTFKKLSKPQMLAICFWPIQKKRIHIRIIWKSIGLHLHFHMGFDYCMEFQEIPTHPKVLPVFFYLPRNSLVVSSREPKPESASPSHSSKVLQENAVEKGCKMKPFKQNQKNGKFKKSTFGLDILQLWKRQICWRILWESSIPVLPCIDSGEVGLQISK